MEHFFGFQVYVNLISVNIPTAARSPSRTSNFDLAGCARGQCVHGAVQIVMQVKTARYRSCCASNSDLSGSSVNVSSYSRRAGSDVSRNLSIIEVPK